MLLNGITSAWLLYDMATADRDPGRALAILQYALLAGALVALVGSLGCLPRKNDCPDGPCRS